MVQTVTISLERPIGSVRIIKNTGSATSDDTAMSEKTLSSAELTRQTKSFMQAAAAMSAVSAKLAEFYEKEVRQHNQQIAKLAVEISRKVLMQEVSESHYKIETIVQEALKNAPSRDNVTVRLNPADAAFCRKMQEENGSELFSGIKITADATVNPADCIVDTPRGLVESFTETHLLHIAEALAQA